jgi:tetratricopeptide (TPR) repeat protein
LRVTANMPRAILIVLMMTGLAAAADPERFLVFPLEDLTKSAALSWLRDGIADSISDQIRLPGIQIGGYEERSRSIEDSDLPPDAPLSRASMIRVAQKSGADHVVMGVLSGTMDNLRVVVRDLTLKTMKLSGEITAKGALAGLPQMENELAWNVLALNGLTRNLSRETFKSRMRLVPNAAYSVYVRGLRATTENEQVQLLTRALEIHPNFPQAQYLLGRYYYQNGECQKAIRYLDPAREREQTYLRAEFMLGSCYLQQNSYSNATQSFSHILAFVRPFEVLNNVGVAYLRAGDVPLAIQNLLEAHDHAKSNPTVSLNLALARHLQKNDAAALDLLQEAIKSYPNNGMLQYVLNVILSTQGESKAAAGAEAEARRLGIDIDKLRREDSKAWARILTVWETGR